MVTSGVEVAGSKDGGEGLGLVGVAWQEGTWTVGVAEGFAERNFDAVWVYLVRSKRAGGSLR